MDRSVADLWQRADSETRPGGNPICQKMRREQSGCAGDVDPAAAIYGVMKTVLFIPIIIGLPVAMGMLCSSPLQTGAT